MKSAHRLRPLGLLVSSVLVVSSSLLGASASAAVPGYRFVDLGTLGGTYSTAADINDLGQIVGVSTTAGNASDRLTVWSDGGTTTSTIPLGGDGAVRSINDAGQIAGNVTISRAAMWSGNNLTLLYAPTGRHSFGHAINNSGQVVGYEAGSFGPLATIWNGETGSTLGASNVTSYAWGINDAGQVVGSATGPDYLNLHATLWSGGNTLDLGTLGGSVSAAYAINAGGVVVGDSSISDASTASHATLWNGTSAIDLGTLGGADSRALDINGAGLVVGFSELDPTSNETHATLWDGTDVVDLNTFATGTDWTLQRANAINAQGWIVGDSFNAATNQAHGYLLIPVPEPESLALALGGLAMLGLWGRRRPGAKVDSAHPV